jgi:hypothetical protein
MRLGVCGSRCGRKKEVVAERESTRGEGSRQGRGGMSGEWGPRTDEKDGRREPLARGGRLMSGGLELLTGAGKPTNDEWEPLTGAGKPTSGES